MKKKLTSLALALVLCLSLSIPALAAEQSIIVNGESYPALLGALVNGEPENKPVTATLNTDVVLTATVVIGSSDYGGLFNGAKVAVPSHDVTIDLNGHTLSGPVGAAILAVQKDYTLTIVDTSEAKTGKLETKGNEEITVEEGAVYNPLTAAKAPTETPAETPAETAPAPETSGTPAAPVFADVAENSPFKDAIYWAVEKGITNGTSATTFSPAVTCTHNHILTFIWRANGKPEAEGNTDFERAIAWAKASGMAAGDVEGYANCTREQAMVYLWKQAGSPETEVTDAFTDVAADADYAQAVSWAVANKITYGTSATTFSPDNICTRGQIVTFLYRSLAK